MLRIGNRIDDIIPENSTAELLPEKGDSFTFRLCHPQVFFPGYDFCSELCFYLFCKSGFPAAVFPDNSINHKISSSPMLSVLSDS